MAAVPIAPERDMPGGTVVVAADDVMSAVDDVVAVADKSDASEGIVDSAIEVELARSAVSEVAIVAAAEVAVPGPGPEYPARGMVAAAEVVVGDSSVDELVKEASESDVLSDASVDDTANEGSASVEVGEASVVEAVEEAAKSVAVGDVSVFETAAEGSRSVEVLLAVTMDGEMPATVEEYSDRIDGFSGMEDEATAVAVSREVVGATVAESREVAGTEDPASVSKVDEDSEDVVDSTVPLSGVWRLCSRWCNSSAC